MSIEPCPSACPAAILRARGREVVFPRRPLIMGILNVNDDSFSGDGRLDPGWALERAEELVRLGADIVDIGAESARTNREAISEEEEFRRLEPVLRGFSETVARSSPRDPAQLFPPLLSVNTWRPEVAGRALDVAGDLLNDMGALPDDCNARHCVRTGAALLIMHSVGLPKQDHSHVTYENVLETVGEFFLEKLRLVEAAGLSREATVLDPGLNFAKGTSDNLLLLAGLSGLVALGRPLLLPVSRKGVIGKILDLPNPVDRDAGTVACLVAGVLRGAAIFRVHNVEMAWRALATLRAVGEGAPPDRD